MDPVEERVKFEPANKFMVEMNYHNEGKSLQRLLNKVEQRWFKKDIKEDSVHQVKNPKRALDPLLARSSTRSLDGGFVHRSDTASRLLESTGRSVSFMGNDKTQKSIPQDG